jgi:hypothetical protein
MVTIGFSTTQLGLLQPPRQYWLQLRRQLNFRQAF